MSERKLASVRRIAAIDPIEGADKIVKVTVDGWQLVSGKENGFQVGDLVCYFEIDSFLPVIPQFEWMRDRCYKNTENLGEGFRVRTIKLRGQVSQGLIVPLSDFFRNVDGVWYAEGSAEAYPLEEGTDVTDFIGVKKFDKPIPAALAGKVRGSFPSFIPKTDQERIQNNFGGIKKWIYYGKPEVTEITDQDMIIPLDLEEGPPNTESVQYFKNGDMWFSKIAVENPNDVVAERQRFEATLKLDGSSMTVYYYNQTIGVCSRNNDLTRDEGNTFWRVAVNSGLVAWLATTGMNIAIQGELMGPGVQGNREQFEEPVMYIFDVYDIDKAVYWTPKQRADMMDWFKKASLINNGREMLFHVPVLGEAIFAESDTVKDFLDEADRTRSINHELAEGIVYKSMVEGGPSFKAISQRFLLAEPD